MGEKGATLDADAMLTSNQGKFTSQTLRHHTFQCLDKWRHLQNCLVKARSILSLTPLVLISSIRYFAKLSANGCWKTPLQPFQGTMRPNKAPSNVALVSLAEIRDFSWISHVFRMDQVAQAGVATMPWLLPRLSATKPRRCSRWWANCFAISDLYEASQAKHIPVSRPQPEGEVSVSRAPLYYGATKEWNRETLKPRRSQKPW